MCEYILRSLCRSSKYLPHAEVIHPTNLPSQSSFGYTRPLLSSWQYPRLLLSSVLICSLIHLNRYTHEIEVDCILTWHVQANFVSVSTSAFTLLHIIGLLIAGTWYLLANLNWFTYLVQNYLVQNYLVQNVRRNVLW